MKKNFDYSLDDRFLDLRKNPRLYRVGKGEQGVLLCEPHKSEILPFWKFKTPALAKQSGVQIFQLFLRYKAVGDFIGMDMARKFLQMGFTRARRYANHSSGKKHNASRKILPVSYDPVKSRICQDFLPVLEKG